MKTHPADNIYYMDVAMLQKLRACPHTIEQWTTLFGDAPVLITVERLEQMAKHGIDDFSYTVDAMCTLDIFTVDEWEEFLDEEIGAFTSFRKAPLHLAVDVYNAAMAEAAMNVLAKRAKREGRIK